MVWWGLTVWVGVGQGWWLKTRRRTLDSAPTAYGCPVAPLSGYGVVGLRVRVPMGVMDVVITGVWESLEWPWESFGRWWESGD
jgi:hypothetical protein